MGKKLDKTVIVEKEKHTSKAGSFLDEDLMSEVSKGLEAEDSMEELGLDPDQDTSLSKEELLKRETTLGTKTVQQGEILTTNEKGKRLDQLSIGKESEALGGTVSRAKGGLLHYEGSLGSFDYDPDAWAVGQKTIQSGSVKAAVPVFRYIGSKSDGNDIQIPDGVKNLDYTFQNLDDLETVPKIPDGVESAHGAFADCLKLQTFCTDSKKNMSEGDVSIKETGVSAVIGSGVGAVVGGVGGLFVGSIPGAFTGVRIGLAAGGAVGGGIGAGKSKRDTKNRGGQAEMPSGIKDGSAMFANTNMTESYAKAGESLLDARGMYLNSVSMGTDTYAMEHNGVAVTDYKDSKCPKEAVQNAYTGTNVEITEQLKGNYSKYWDEETGTYNKPGTSADEKAEIEALNRLMKAENEKNGVTETTMSKDTDGLAYSAKVRTETGYKDTQNIHDKNVKSDRENMLGSVGSFLDRAAVSLGEYTIIQKLTGSRILGAIATFGLQTIGILPKSMKPIVNAAAKMFGEDSAVGKGLTAFSKMLGGKDDTDVSSKQGVSNKKSDQRRSGESISKQADGSVYSQVSDDFQKVSISSENSDELKKQMASEGKQIVHTPALSDAAGLQADSQDLSQIEMLMSTVGAGFVNQTEGMAKNGSLSRDQKEQLSDQVVSIMDGLSAYDTAAKSEIQSSLKGSEAEMSTRGLEKVMASSAVPILDSVKELDAKYGFLTKDAKSHLQSLSISGVPKYDEYQPGSDVFPKKSESFADESELDDDESMYGNAYLDDVETKNNSSGQLDTKIVTAGVSKSQLSGKKRRDRGAMAEEMAKRVGGFSEQESSDNFEYD